MAYSLSTSGPDYALLSIFLSNKALLTLLPNLELYQYGREAVVPEGAGKEIYLPRFFDRSTAAGSLAESTTSATIVTSAMSAATLTGNLVEYGKAIGLGRFLWSTKNLPLLEEATKQLMVSIGKAWESDIQVVICSNATMSAASTVRAGGGIDGSVTEGLSLKPRAISEASTILANKFNPGFTEFGGAYGGVISPTGKHHLLVNTSSGTQISFEQQSMNMTSSFRNSVMGNLFNVRLSVSAFSTKFVHATHGMSESNSGILNYIFAPEAFAVAPLAVARPEIILHGFGSGGVSDPLNRRATIGAYGVFDSFTDVTNVLAVRAIHLVHGITL